MPVINSGVSDPTCQNDIWVYAVITLEHKMIVVVHIYTLQTFLILRKRQS